MNRKPFERGKGMMKAGDILQNSMGLTVEANHPPLKPTATDNAQLHLWQNLLCNTEEERQDLANAIEDWDIIPKYSISRAAMKAARDSGGDLENFTFSFQSERNTYNCTIYPARVEDLDGVKKSFFPSANEEILEDVLRKMALEQQAGFFDKPNFLSGVVFSQHRLREELAKCEHTRSYQEILLSFDIMTKCIMDIAWKDERGNTGFIRSAFVPSLATVNKSRLKDDPKAKWVAHFHPFVTGSIDNITYRQYNWRLGMKLKTPLARWLQKYIAIKYTFANSANPFEMHYQTVKEKSLLFTEYTRERNGIAALVDALTELKNQGILSSFDRRDVKGPRNKIQDVVFTIWPSFDFVKEVKAANRRQRDALQTMNAVGSSSGSRQIPVGRGGGSR
jgi:hypothetical protein